MLNNQRNQNLLFRDGACKQDQNLERLVPTYAPVEDRNIEQFIEEAQRIAKELRFFNSENQVTSSWESFLIEDRHAYNASGADQESLRQEWASKMAQYVDNPESFLNDPETLKKLSSPHAVLFMTFLKLLNQVKSQINGLTKKHLDFYFYERLKLTPKDSVPDVVNILLQLAENVEQLEIKAGTVFLAGEDAEGNELAYVTTEDTIINQAKIAQVKNVFVDKRLLTIKDAHLNGKNNLDDGLTAMLEIALGHPNPGDRLPELPETITDVNELYDSVTTGNEAAESYVAEKLFLSLDDFKYIFQQQQNDQEGITANWQNVYLLLENAHRTKTKKGRKENLRDLHNRKGFDELVRHVYGAPEAGDNLPPYKGRTAFFTLIHDDLKHPDAITQQSASEYISRELKLSNADFDFIVLTSSSESAEKENDWDKVYQLLEATERQVRRVVLSPPALEKTLNIYGTQDARELAFSQYNHKEESKRFRTFGSGHTQLEGALQPAQLGFAISSPTLLLKEGKRTITLLQDINLDSDRYSILETLVEKDIFQVHLSNSSGWFTAEHVAYTLGDFISSESNDEVVVTSLERSDDDQNILILNIDVDQNTFNSLDIGKYVIDSDGKIYELKVIRTSSTAEVQHVGALGYSIENAKIYASGQVFLKTLKVEINLREEDLPVTTLDHPSDFEKVGTEWPSVVISVNSGVTDQINQQYDFDVFDCLMAVTFKKIHLKVAVEELRNITLQNDQSSINIKKPFEPFGSEPEIGDNFYFAHEEVSQKAITDLQLYVQWANAPADFKAHYAAYWKIKQDDPNLEEEAYEIQKNEDFKVSLLLYDNFAEIPVTNGINLFPKDQMIAVNNLPRLIQESRPQYTYQTDKTTDQAQREVTDWKRYFKLELTPMDFQHQLYNSLFTKQAFSTDESIKALSIHPPYQPKLKSLSLGYTAEADILQQNNTVVDGHKLFQIHPFGIREQRAGAAITLLPEYQDNGTLYLGISGVNPPQVLSILFQMAEGSANPEVEKPELRWSYLRDGKWVTLQKSNIITDGTNGLLNTGVIKLNVPKDATTGGTLLSDSLHWLKISANNHIDGISDTIDIKSQVVTATLSHESVANAHFQVPLKEDSIRATQDFIPEIDTISQPYTSSKGKPAEDTNLFYKRISERLRHKNRALNMWDYEHLVLDNFPQIYKVKCLPARDELGKVMITVIPDIRDRLPFNPYAPKVGSAELLEIKEFLTNRVPAFAEITVNNPTYLQVMTRCSIKFHQGYDPQFYQTKLIDEIKRFLSPWAYDDPTNISLGGTLDAGVLINFIAEKNYVDFVANLKLFQIMDGEITDVITLNDGKNTVVPNQPDMILVTAETHQIDIVDSNVYDEDLQEGINYMVIGVDFEVARDL